MSLLSQLNDLNDVTILSVRDEAFRTYGRLLTCLNREGLSEVLTYMKEETSVPEEGNIYIASDPELEKLPLIDRIQKEFYGNMPIQVGYCNGRNSTYNGFEYHKGSEINIMTEPCMLALGHSYDIDDKCCYDNKNAQVFFLEAGDVIEMYQTTLHLSPLRVQEEGFKAVVILPRGTNTPLENKEEIKKNAKDPETKLLLQTNKWVIAHPERKPLIDQGAFPGIIGSNKELYFPGGDKA